MLEAEVFQACATSPSAKHTQKKRTAGVKKRHTLDEEGSILRLSRLCLLSLVDNMETVWVKDYKDNYLDRYHFRHIMGPFNILPGELVQALTRLLCSRKRLSRAALHLLLVPQLRGLSLAACPGLVTPTICSIIAARCQCLSHLDLSGAQQASSQAQANLISSLPALRSLSLAGTPCDRGVIETIARCCSGLRHLDVSRCRLLSPAALLPLGGRASSDGAACCTDTCKHGVSPSSPVTLCRRSSPSSSSPSSSCALPLRCLLVTDIGFGDEEREPAAAAAYLLLSLPTLENVAMEGLDQAFGAIHRREFHPTEEFTRREGVPPLEEVWRQRENRRENTEAGVVISHKEGKEHGEEEEERFSDGDEERDHLAAGEEVASGIGHEDKLGGARVVGEGAQAGLTLRLREIRALTPCSLEVAGQLCPHIQSVAVNVDPAEVTAGMGSQGSLLAAGLRIWSGQLRRLTLCHTGPLGDLLPALRGTGSSLVSLTLEGVKTSPNSPLLEVLQACPRLRELVVSAQPPTDPLYEDEEEGEIRGARDLLCLSQLCSLTLSFDYEPHTEMVMSWRALQRVLLSLLWGSPLLEKLHLNALPCPLNSLLCDIISSQLHHQHHPGPVAPAPPQSTPLGRLTHIGLARSDVTMATVMRLLEGCRRVKSVNLSCCWKISRQDVSASSFTSPCVTFEWQ